MKTRNIDIHVAVIHRLRIPAAMAGRAALRGQKRALERLAKRILGNGGLIQVAAAFGPDGRCIYEQ